MNYYEFVVDPESPALQDGVIEVGLTLTQNRQFARVCAPGDCFKISDTDLPGCLTALNSYQDDDIEPTYLYFQAVEHESDPSGVLDFMSFVT